MMYAHDPRFQPQSHQQPQLSYATVASLPMEMQHLLSSMQTQLNLCTEYMRADMSRKSEAGSSVCPVRLRESDSNIYCELYLPQLTVGDVEVEVVGNRIVCRTRVPMAARNWLSSSQVPRGFECFTLPDGRVELCWLCPVAFQAKEVEACFRDNCLCICIPKTEAVAARQPVKVVANETTLRVQ